jgi:hypothetical protein
MAQTDDRPKGEIMATIATVTADAIAAAKRDHHPKFVVKGSGAYHVFDNVAMAPAREVGFRLVFPDGTWGDCVKLVAQHK